MKLLNGIFGLALLLLFACDPDDQTINPNGNVDQNNNGTTVVDGNVSNGAQNVLQLSSNMQELESIGFGRPSIINRGFGFAPTRNVIAGGRVRTDGDDEDDDDEEGEDEDWELDEETLALIEKLEALEGELDSLEVQIDMTEDPDAVEELEAAADEIRVEIEELEEALEEKFEEFEEEHGEYYIEDCEHTSCATEEFIDNGDGSHTWVIDYGEGCEEYEGEILKGKIIETFTETEDGFSGTIVFENFGDDEYIINGTETFSGSFEGDEDEEKGSYTYSESLQITFEDGVYTVNSSGTESFDSLGYSITGTTRYESSDGDFAETEITTPLYFSYACEDQDVFEPVIGVETTVYQEGNESGTFTVDFGDGSCDNIITVTEDINTYTIDLSEEWEDDEEDEDDEDDDEDEG